MPRFICYGKTGTVTFVVFATRRALRQLMRRQREFMISRASIVLLRAAVAMSARARRDAPCATPRAVLYLRAMRVYDFHAISITLITPDICRYGRCRLLERYATCLPLFRRFTLICQRTFSPYDATIRRCYDYGCRARAYAIVAADADVKDMTLCPPLMFF